MTLDIAAIKARADAASEGPWAKNPFTAHVDAFEQGYPIPVCALLWPTDLRTEDQSIADGEFIAHARTDIPDLLAALEASEADRVKAEQERDALKEALKDAAEALGSLIDTSERFNRPYEHPLSAYDRARRVLEQKS